MDLLADIIIFIFLCFIAIGIFVTCGPIITIILALVFWAFIYKLTHN